MSPKRANQDWGPPTLQFNGYHRGSLLGGITAGTWG